MVDLNLLGAKVYLPWGLFDGGVSIDEGRIVKVGKEAHLPESSRVENLNGLVLLPGLIDAHVHLRDLELAFKEDFHTGTCAAAAGGFTTVLDMPNTKPMTDSREHLKEKMATASSKIIVNVGFYASFPADLRLMTDLAVEGAIAFKGHLHKDWSKLDLSSGEVLSAVASEATRLGKVVAFHAEDKATVKSMEERLKAEGRRNPEDYLAAHSVEAEVKAVTHILRSISRRVRVHICHVSSTSSLELVMDARVRGFKVTCEVTPHHLFLTDATLKRLRGFALTAPPVRNTEEAQGLWRALQSGSVDILVSDHAPHTLEDKNHPDIWEISPGIPGLETTLPLLLTKIRQGEFTLADLVRTLAQRPAEIFKLERKGKIWQGYDADLTAIDTTREHKIDTASFYSKAKFSPFEGWKAEGKAVRTYVAGKLVMEDGAILGKGGVGSILKGGTLHTPGGFV
ncbi:MAG: dihydroorotase family protein [Candidatus Bathyarchaeia archaeon]